MRTPFWRDVRMVLSEHIILNQINCWELLDNIKKINIFLFKTWLCQGVGIFWHQLLMITPSSFMMLASSNKGFILLRLKRKILMKSQKESRWKMVILRKILRTCKTAVMRWRKRRSQRRQKRRRARRWQWRRGRPRWRSTANVNFSKDSDVICS